MFSKTNLTATLATTVWAFFGGYLLWGIIADSTLREHVVTSGIISDEPDKLHLVLGCLIVAFTFCTIYSKWAKGHHSASEGLKFGVWIGVLLGLGLGLVNFSTSNLMDLTGTLIDGVVSIVHFAIIGLIAGTVYSKMASE